MNFRASNRIEVFRARFARLRFALRPSRESHAASETAIATSKVFPHLSSVFQN
jgi:hypothetical protein